MNSLATYQTWDIKGTRIHHWMPKNIWAKGFGPIEHISEEEAMEFFVVEKTQAKQERKGV